MSPRKIAVVGGGIAGSSISLYLSELGLDVTLFEKGVSLVNGPPICHLHAGGNLYREISDEQCVTLLKESIDLVRFYPDAVDYRPTVIAVPVSDSGKPQDLFRRLALLTQEYESLVEENPSNKVLGPVSEYFKVYERAELELLRAHKESDLSKPCDKWMLSVAKNVDFDTLKFPLILVQEYGLNIFRLGATAALALEKKSNVQILLEHRVNALFPGKNSEICSLEYNYQGVKKEESFDFLINAAGFKSGTLDDMLGVKRERLVEFKAAYVSHWDKTDERWPEVVFLGERGTPQGMGQFTPYPGGYFQLHAMTKEITLFEDGLVKSSQESAYPKLQSKLLDKIERNWSISKSQQRTKLAIEHLAQFIPSFKKASVGSKPLYGAQQIPGDDETLRAAGVSFEGEHYARCEIVKASSVLSMADAITAQLVKLGYLSSEHLGRRNFSTVTDLDEAEVSQRAEGLCVQREYPVDMAQRITKQVQ